MSTAPRPPALQGAERSPGEEAAIRARNAIERAIAAIPAIPLALDRGALGERLRRAIQCVYAVIDSDVLAPVHHEGLAEGAAVLREAIALLEGAGAPDADPSLADALTALEAAVRELSAGADTVAQIQLARRLDLHGAAAVEVPPARPFHASVGVPSLHAFPRRPLIPELALDPVKQPPQPSATRPKLPRPATLEELKAFAGAAASGELQASFMAAAEPAPEEPEAPPPFAYEPAIEEVEMVRRLARDCLEDIAVHRDLRKPNAIETWLDQEPFEQRMLDDLDAFASFTGAALPIVSLYHAEAKSADPGRAFAVALTLGSIEGSDTVFSAVATLKQSAPETFPGWVEGFTLAPSPVVDAAMADLCTSDRPELVALGLDVLHARGATPDEVVTRLLPSADPSIARRVARALATALPASAAVEHLQRVAAETDDDELHMTAIESLLRRGDPGAPALLRRAADTPSRARAAVPLLCLVGHAGDVSRVLDALREGPTVDLLRSAGRLGHVDTLDALVDCLHGDNAEVIAAAAEALERITGAGLRETVEEPWDIELPPGAEEAGGIPVPLRKVERIVTDPERWSAWVRDEARQLDRKVKTRGGVPFTPLRIIEELESPATPPGRREEAARELVLLTGGVFSPHDWVARQKVRLADLRAEVEGLRASPGVFGILTRRPVVEEAPPEPEPAPLPVVESPAPLAELKLGATMVLPALSAEMIEVLAKKAVPFRKPEPLVEEIDHGPESEDPDTVPVPRVPARSALPFRPDAAAIGAPANPLDPPGRAALPFVQTTPPERRSESITETQPVVIPSVELPFERPQAALATSIGLVSAATVAFRAGGVLYLTAVVKATFALVSEGRMSLLEPEPIARGEEHDPSGAGLRTAGDLAPYLTQPEVWLTGHVAVPPRFTQPTLRVQLAVVQAGAVRIDKQLDLPVASAAGDPPRVRITGMGPLAADWPPRRRWLEGVDRRGLTGAVLELPEGLHWEYFQATPGDQRIESLQGDEWLVLGGIVAGRPRLRTQLPAARAAARLYRRAQASPRAGEPITLNLDTLQVDADRQRCSMLWRGMVPLADESELSSVRVAAGMETGGQPVAWVDPFLTEPLVLPGTLRPASTR